jgi:hypothetical protein
MGPSMGDGSSTTGTAALQSSTSSTTAGVAGAAASPVVDATNDPAAGAGGSPRDGRGLAGGSGGGPGGFGGGLSVTGSVTAVDAGVITVETAGGRAQTIATDSTTTYHQEAPATAEDITVGASVRIAVNGGQLGPGGGDASDATLTASDVLVLDP